LHIPVPEFTYTDSIRHLVHVIYIMNLGQPRRK
jgi:hypothetical protein